MPEKIKVRTGKPSDSCCISWEYQPNELEKAKYTAREFFDNVTRIWTHITHEARTQGAKPLRPFFLHIVRKGKRKYKDKAGKERQGKMTSKDNQSKEGQRTRSRSKEIKTGAKREKERQTRKRSFIRLTLHAHKSPTSHTNHATKQTHTSPIKPSKNAQKSEIEPYLQAIHQRQSMKGNKREGTHDQRTRANPFQVLKPSKACTLLPPVDTPERQTSRATTCTHFAPTFQKYIRFLPFVVSQITRVWQNQANKY